MEDKVLKVTVQKTDGTSITQEKFDQGTVELTFDNVSIVPASGTKTTVAFQNFKQASFDDVANPDYKPKLVKWYEFHIVGQTDPIKVEVAETDVLTVEKVQAYPGNSELIVKKNGVEIGRYDAEKVSITNGSELIPPNS